MHAKGGILENAREMDPPWGGDEQRPRGDDFQFLPARSRTAVYVPHGMEIALPSLAEKSKNFSTPPTDFFNRHDRSRLTPGAEVNITNNTTVLVVDVPLKPIEKLKRAVKKMQRVSSKICTPFHPSNPVEVFNSKFEGEFLLNKIRWWFCEVCV